MINLVINARHSKGRHGSPFENVNVIFRQRSVSLRVVESGLSLSLPPEGVSNRFDYL